MRNAAESIDVPYWIMGQRVSLYDIRGPFRKTQGFRYPTIAQVRWQLWTAIQEGAKGVFYFMYQNQSGPPSTEHRGQYIFGLRGEGDIETPQYREAAEMGMPLKYLAPVLLKLEVAPPE